MKTIRIDNKEILLDDRDFYWVTECTLRVTAHAKNKTSNFYAYTGNEALHRRIYKLHVGAIPSDKVVDHINRNSLDDRLVNLRLLTNEENLNCNRKKPLGCSSAYIGVCKYKDKWKTRYQKAGYTASLGVYSTEREAAIAHDLFACSLSRNPLRLNFPEEMSILRELEV